MKEPGTPTHTAPSRFPYQNATLYRTIIQMPLEERKTDKTSHNINLPDLALRPLLAAQSFCRVPYESLFRANLLVEDAQSLGAVDAMVGQYYGTVFHDTLSVEGVGNVARQLVELGTTDWAYGHGRGSGVCGGWCVGGMTGGCLERGETGAQGDVEERPRGQGVEGVMSRDEAIGQMRPP